MSTPLSAIHIVSMLAALKSNPVPVESAHARLMEFIDQASAALDAAPQDDTPIVWVEMNDGRVNNVVADRPCQLVVTETDLEGVDEDDPLIEHGGNDLFLYKSLPAAEVDPETVIALLEKAEMAMA